MSWLIYFLWNKVSKKSLLWPLKPKRRPKSHKKPTIWGSFYDLPTYTFRKKSLFCRAPHEKTTFLRKLFWPFTHCYRKKSFFRYHKIMHRKTSWLKRKKSGFSKKIAKEQTSLTFNLDFKLTFQYDFWTKRCRIWSRIVRYQKVLTPEIAETTWLQRKIWSMKIYETSAQSTKTPGLSRSHSRCNRRTFMEFDF